MEIEHEQSQVEQVKVYSFWKNKQNYQDVFKINNKIMSEVDIFMPIFIYKFELEIIEKEKLLNTFEETILKLAEIEITEESLIHQAILLEEDLIKFIQNKLIEKNFLNNDNRISLNGIKYLIQNDLSKKIYDQDFKLKIENSNVQYKNDSIFKTGYTFVGINQELSPIIEFRNIQSMYITGDYQEYLNQKDKSILNFSMKVGSAGNAQSVNGILNRYAQSYLSQNPQITQLNIKDNFEKFFSKLQDLDNKINNKNIFESYVGQENKSVSLYSLNQLEKIKIIGTEKGYMHYKVIILDGDAENIVISDGFSMYNPKLSSYLKKNYISILEYLNETATKSKSVSKNKIKKYTKNINDKYSDIKENLKPIRSIAQASINAPDKQNKIKIQNKKIVANYYNAISLSIYYYIKNSIFDYNNSSILIDFINLYSEDEKIAKLKALLSNININVQDYKQANHHKLFELDSKKILDYKKTLNQNTIDNINAKVLLLLIVIEANENKKNSSFYLFINDSSENQNKIFLSRIYQILKIKNKDSHGKSHYNNVNDEKSLKKYYSYTYALASYLLKDFYIDNSDNNIFDNNTADASQEIINSNSYLSNKFGILVYNKIFESNEKYFRVLALLKINYLEGDDINILDIIKTMSSLFESIFRLHIENSLKLHKNEKIKVSKDDVIQILKLNLTGFNIPSELLSVRETYFENACYCRNASIGAYILLFINDVLTTKNNQNNLTELQIIIITVCKVISYRGNGSSNANITISNQELLSLVDEVFDITKKIINIIE